MVGLQHTTGELLAIKSGLNVSGFVRCTKTAKMDHLYTCLLLKDNKSKDVQKSA
jgi:hypothetical protein